MDKEFWWQIFISLMVCIALLTVPYIMFGT